MANVHDTVFKDLIAHREFAVSFLQQYMPRDLAERVNWESVHLDTANVEHTRQQQKTNLKQKEQSDLTFLFHFQDGKQGAIFVHIESQTGNDGTLILRTRHYQTSYLLDYMKRHKTTKNLPLVVSILYYANRQPFSYSLDIHDYFQNKELAQKHAFSMHFVDVSRMSDEDVEEHGFIAGYELILKAIRDRKLDGKIGFLVHHLELYDSIVRQVLIRYMSRYSDLDTDTFYDRMIEKSPELQGDVMTVAQQWEQKGVERGIEQGVEIGKLNTAQNLMNMGLSVSQIAQATGLDSSVIESLKH